MTDWATRRAEMVRYDIARRGVRDPRVLEAMRSVPRERFVAPGAADACADRPLPIGCRQTISQPYIVARMTELLRLSGTERVLEIGTGSGYQTAVLARLAREVCTVERHAELSEIARAALADCENVRFLVGDGTLGWAEAAPFERVLVTAAGPRIPEALLAQLAPDGRLVAPVGPRGGQTLTVATRDAAGRLSFENDIDCIFVPLVGQDGY